MLSRGVTAADQWGLRVVSVDYTLAPRAKYNQITDECVAVIKALMQQGTMVENIAIYGDSTGGGLGAAVVLKIRDQGVGLPAALAVLSPWLDLTQDPTRSHRFRTRRPVTLRNTKSLQQRRTPISRIIRIHMPRRFTVTFPKVIAQRLFRSDSKKYF